MARMYNRDGLCKHELYHVWVDIIQRCNNPNHKAYKYYGGKGVTICDSWRSSFGNFLKDMGERPGPKYTVDRKENNKGYYKDNCEWKTMSEQSENRSSTILLTYNGKTQSINKWAKELGITFARLKSRIYISKWPIYKALSKS